MSNETVLLLKRTHDNGIRTLGIARCGDNYFYTLERPWKGNERYKSCIPPGQYRLSKYMRSSGKWSYAVHDVPGRSSILIHVGNDVEDTSGCILPGMRPHTDGVLDSRVAMDKLLSLSLTKIIILIS